MKSSVTGRGAVRARGRRERRRRLSARRRSAAVPRRIVGVDFWASSGCGLNLFGGEERRHNAANDNMKRFEIITEADARVLDIGETVELKKGGHVTRSPPTR